MAFDVKRIHWPMTIQLKSKQVFTNNYIWRHQLSNEFTYLLTKYFKRLMHGNSQSTFDVKYHRSLHDFLTSLLDLPSTYILTSFLHLSK